MIFKNLPFIATVGGLVGGYISVFHKHTFGARTRKRKLSYYQDDSHHLDAGTQSIVDRLTDRFLMTMTVKQIANVEFFFSNQSHPLHFGAIKSRYGAYIGIPISFRYKTISDINTSSFVSDKFPINHPSIQRLLDSLVLSDNAKEFAIASEVHSANSPYLYFRASFCFMVMFGYSIAYFSRHFLHRRSPVFQVAYMFGLVVSLMTVYMHFQGKLEFFRQRVSDKRAAEMDREFLDGGLEYLSKQIQRNLALREMDTQLGPLLYDVHGNQIQGIFEIPVLPLTERLSRLQTLQNVSSEEDKKSTEEA